MAFPRPPTEPIKLEEEDISFILDQTLRPEHRINAEVVRYILAYLNCRDVAQAAKEAHISITKALRFKQRKDIHEAIVKITDTAVMKYGLDPEEIVAKVKEIAFFDPATLCNPDGSFIENLHEIPAESRRAIKKFTAENIYEKDPNGMPVIKGRLIKVEFWDKLRGNELLGRETQLFKETSVVEHDLTTNMRDLLLESKARAEQRALESREANQKPVLEIVAGTTEVSAGGSAMPLPGPVKDIDET